MSATGLNLKIPLSGPERRVQEGAGTERKKKKKAKIHQTSPATSPVDATKPLRVPSTCFFCISPTSLQHSEAQTSPGNKKKTSLTTGPPAGRASCRIICAYRLRAPFTITNTGTRNRWRLELGLVNILFSVQPLIYHLCAVSLPSSGPSRDGQTLGSAKCRPSSCQPSTVARPDPRLRVAPIYPPYPASGGHRHRRRG